MTNTHLFNRDFEGTIGHTEYTPGDMVEVFTPQQLQDLFNGKTVQTGRGTDELTWVSANAICRKILMKESRVSSVTRARKQGREFYVSHYGPTSKIVTRYDIRTADMIAQARRADAEEV